MSWCAAVWLGCSACWLRHSSLVSAMENLLPAAPHPRPISLPLVLKSSKAPYPPQRGRALPSQSHMGKNAHTTVPASPIAGQIECVQPRSQPFPRLETHSSSRVLYHTPFYPRPPEVSITPQPSPNRHPR